MEEYIKSLKDLIKEMGADMDAFVFCAVSESNDKMPMMMRGSAENIFQMLAQTLAEAITCVPKACQPDFAQAVCDYLNKSLDESEEKKVN